MIPDIPLIVGASALGISIVSLFLQGVHRRGSLRRAESARAALERHEALCSERFESVRKGQETLEASFQNTREVLRDGRLNRSSRAAALHLLRTGMSPDTAALSLGIAKREIRMLAKVSALLGAN